jgi:hypothetical protein
MRPLRLPHSLSLIVSLTLVFLGRLISGQEAPFASKAPIQFAGLATRPVAVPEAGIRFNPAYEKLALPSAPNQGTPLPRLRPFDADHLSALTENDSSKRPWQLTNLHASQVTPRQVSGSAPAQWFTYPTPPSTAHYSAPDGGDALQYYGNRIPWAGAIILGIGEQARFHPRVARVVQLIRPALSMGKRPYPRWIGK